MKRTRFSFFIALLSLLAAAPLYAQPARREPDLRPDRVGRDAAALPPPTETDIAATLGAVSTPGGMTADQAAVRAVRAAPSLERANATLMAAEAGAAQAYIALFPDLRLNARYTHLSRVVNRLSSATPEEIELAQTVLMGVDDPEARLLIGGILDAQTNIRFPFYRNQYAFNAQLTYPVSATFTTLLPLYRAAGHAREAARLQVEVERQSIAIRARQAFYEYARALGAMAVAEQARTTVQAHRDQVGALVGAGVAPRVDLMRVEAQVAEAEVTVANARMGVEISGRALALLLAHRDEALPVVSVGEDFTAEIEPPAASVDDLESLAYDRRPELEAMRELYRAQELRARGQSAARYPQVVLQGNFDYANPNQRYFPQQRRFRETWDVSALLTWSPNDTAVAQAQYRAARAEMDRIDAEHQALLDGLRIEVSQGYHQLIAARAAYEAAVVQVRAADENYRVRFEQLRQGAAVTSDLIDAQTELTRARLSLVDAAIQMRIARAQLGRAIGEDVETR